MTHEQLSFKKQIESIKCATHQLTAELVINDKGYELHNVCCEEFEKLLTEKVINQIADETFKDIGL